MTKEEAEDLNGNGEEEGEGLAVTLSADAAAERQAVMLLYQRGRISVRQRDAMIMRIVRAEQRVAALRPPLTTAQYDEALSDLDDDMTLAEWRRSSLVLALYHMVHNDKRSHNSVKAHLQREQERSKAEPIEPGPRGGVTRQRQRRAITDPEVLKKRQSALSAAREALRQKREAGLAARPGPKPGSRRAKAD